MRAVDRAFEVVLRLYPRGFREQFGNEMRAFARDRAAEPRFASTWGSAWLWWHLLADAVIGAARERFRSRDNASHPSPSSHLPDAEPPEETMATLVHDARYALRTLRRRPGFTAVSAVTLALGIGATSAIFGVIDGLLFRPLRYPDAHQIVVVTMTRGASLDEPPAYPDFIDWREQARSFQSLAVVRSQSVNLTGRESPERLGGSFVSANLFSLLGAAPIAGRAFSREETEVGTARPLAVISEGLWRRRFGADPAMLGRAVVLNGTQFEIIGIMPSTFRFFGATDVWLPITYYPNSGGLTRKDHSMTVVGRLQPNVTVASAR